LWENVLVLPLEPTVPCVEVILRKDSEHFAQSNVEIKLIIENININTMSGRVRGEQNMIWGKYGVKFVVDGMCK